MLKKIFLILTICLFLTGCSAVGSTPKTNPEAEKHATQIFAMNTVMDIQFYGGDDALLDRVSKQILQLEHTLSTTDTGSEIYKLNHTGSVTLSEKSAELLSRGLEFCEKTQGVLDLSIYPVVRSWGFTTDVHHIPPQQELDTLLSHVDYTKIQFSPEGRSVSLPQGMEIDLGSIAKGFAGDEVLRLLRENGVTSALLNLGGNVQALGTKPDGSRWRIGVRDPLGNGNLGILSIANQAVITSGGYERYFEGEDGQIYWHIIDPTTGYPAKNGLISATAVGPEGVYCDALSTSLFIMGPERATEFWKTHRDFDMILVTENGQVLITPDLAPSFTLTENAPYELRVIAND